MAGGRWTSYPLPPPPKALNTSTCYIPAQVQPGRFEICPYTAIQIIDSHSIDPVNLQKSVSSNLCSRAQY